MADESPASTAAPLPAPPTTGAAGAAAALAAALVPAAELAQRAAVQNTT
jgi:hypothetical protein